MVQQFFFITRYTFRHSAHCQMVSACFLVDSLSGALKPFPRVKGFNRLLRTSKAASTVYKQLPGCSTSCELLELQGIITAFIASATRLLKSCAAKWTFISVFSTGCEPSSNHCQAAGPLQSDSIQTSHHLSCKAFQKKSTDQRHICMK